MARRLLAAVLLSFAAAGAARAQAPAAASQADRDAVLAVVRRVFDAMRTGDSAAARSAFHPNAFLTTAIVRQGVPQLNIDTLENFIRFVGSPRPEVVDERLRNEVVHIDGPLAVVWTDYSLYVGTRFSHCGVDAFQLVNTPGGWKIFAFADTRRRQGCPDQPAN